MKIRHNSTQHLPRDPSNKRLAAFSSQPKQRREHDRHVTPHLGIRPHDQLAQLIHQQDATRESERKAPEHAGDGSHIENLLKSRSVKVDYRDQRCGDHTARHGQITAGTPEGIRVDHRDATVTNR